MCKYTYSVDAIIGADPAAINVKPQLAQLSVLNVSNLAPKVDSLFNDLSVYRITVGTHTKVVK